MKALLMHPGRDFDPSAPLPAHHPALIQDLALDTLVSAMAGGDAYLAEIARVALLSGLTNPAETIRYRQDILKDSLRNAAVVRALYDIALEAIDTRRHGYFGFLSRYPSGMLHGSLSLLEALMVMLRKVRAVADHEAGQFASRGFVRFFGMLRSELSDAYLAGVDEHLARLAFRQGVLQSAELGGHNEGINYVLREPLGTRQNWFQRMLRRGPPAYTFRIHERDEAGARALSDIRNRGLARVANAAAQSAEHLLGFFEMLRAELAFYVCGLNLYAHLDALGAATCFPVPAAPGSRALRFADLYDVCLTLTLGRRAVGNSIDADGKDVVIITGANQGGKSSFLRSIGLAQLMMHAGLFVGATSFTAERCADLFTHYKREEDATMQRGKLDEELHRLSGIADAIAPDAILLLNESFAATNEREGSAIASQAVRALAEKRIRVFFVTHLYAFARALFDQRRPDMLFLRAERLDDGTRTFRVVPGEPLDTSFGEDLYVQVFGSTLPAAD